MSIEARASIAGGVYYPPKVIVPGCIVHLTASTVNMTVNRVRPLEGEQHKYEAECFWFLGDGNIMSKWLPFGILNVIPQSMVVFGITIPPKSGNMLDWLKERLAMLPEFIVIKNKKHEVRITMDSMKQEISKVEQDGVEITFKRE